MHAVAVVSEEAGGVVSHVAVLLGWDQSATAEATAVAAGIIHVPNPIVRAEKAHYLAVANNNL